VDEKSSDRQSDDAGKLDLPRFDAQRASYKKARAAPLLRKRASPSDADAAPS
jgi:hypothetical protein